MDTHRDKRTKIDFLRDIDFDESVDPLGGQIPREGEAQGIKITNSSGNRHDIKSTDPIHNSEDEGMAAFRKELKLDFIHSLHTLAEKRHHVFDAYQEDSSSAAHARNVVLLLREALGRGEVDAAAGLAVVAMQLETPHDVAVQAFHQCRHLEVALDVLKALEGLRISKEVVYDFYRLLACRQTSEGWRGEILQRLAAYQMERGDHGQAFDTLHPIVVVPPFRDDPNTLLLCGRSRHMSWLQAAANDLGSIGLQLDHQNEPEQGRVWPAIAEATVQSMGAMLREKDDGQEGSLVTRGPPRAIPGVPADVSLESLVRDFENQSRDFWFRFRSADQRQEGAQFGRNAFWEEEQGQEKSGGEGAEMMDDGEGRILAGPDMDPQLCPLWPHPEDYGKPYKLMGVSRHVGHLQREAEEFLTRCLQADASCLAALLPLVQILVADGAPGYAERLAQHCCLACPCSSSFSVLAIILEAAVPPAPQALLRCYASLLHCRPASQDAVLGLCLLYKQGFMSAATLMEALALHLDVAPGTTIMWQHLASCLLSVRQAAFGSIPQDSKGDFISPRNAADSSSLRQVARQKVDKSARDLLLRLWQERARWWSKRHFGSGSMCASTAAVNSTDLWRLSMLTWKAACAVLILGPSNKYTAAVQDILAIHPQEAAVLAAHCACAWPRLPQQK